MIAAAEEIWRPKPGPWHRISPSLLPIARENCCKTADLDLLGRDAPAVVGRLFPGYAALFAARSWKMFPRIDRVYVNERARDELGWQPRHNFEFLLDRLRADEDVRSPLAQLVGSKGYHAETFAEGPYPVE